MAEQGTTEAPANTAEGAGNQVTAEAQGAGTQTANTEGTQGTEARFTQADIDRIVRDRLAKEKETAKRQAEAEKAKQDGDYQKLLTQREQELVATQSELKTERTKSAFYAEASKQSIAKADAAWKLIKDDVQYDEAGQPTNIAELLKAAVKEVPGLTGQAVAQSAGGSTNAARQPALTKEAVEKMSSEEIQTRWPEIEKAMTSWT